MSHKDYHPCSHKFPLPEFLSILLMTASSPVISSLTSKEPPLPDTAINSKASIFITLLHGATYTFLCIYIPNLLSLLLIMSPSLLAVTSIPFCRSRCTVPSEPSEHDDRPNHRFPPSHSRFQFQLYLWHRCRTRSIGHVPGH